MLPYKLSFVGLPTGFYAGGSNHISGCTCRIHTAKAACEHNKSRKLGGGLTDLSHLVFDKYKTMK